MTKTALRLAAIVMSILLVAAGCHRAEKPAATGTAATQTVAPAPAQPSPTGTDAMTQTVEVEDSRSEEDGGVNSDNSGKATPKTARRPAKTRKH